MSTTLMLSILQGDATFEWPGAAVPAIADLEKVAHDTYSVDFQKYNQKMRSLAFNLKVAVSGIYYN